MLGLGWLEHAVVGVRTVELGHSLSCCSLQNNSQWPWTGSEQPREELLQHCLHFPVWTKNKQQTSIIPPPAQSAPVGSVPAFSRLCSSQGVSHPGGRGWHIVPTSIGTWSPCPSPAETSCTPRLPSSTQPQQCQPGCVTLIAHRAHWGHGTCLWDFTSSR